MKKLRILSGKFKAYTVDDFIRRKLERLEGVFQKIFPLLVTHMVSEPDVEGYAKGKEISMFYFYKF